MSKHTYRLGRRSLAKLAVIAETTNAVSDSIEIEVHDDPTQRPGDPVADFRVNKTLLRSAKLGLAALVRECNSNLAGVNAEAAAARLRTLGVDEVTAKQVCEQLQASGVLSAVELNRDQVHAGIEALGVGSHYFDES